MLLVQTCDSLGEKSHSQLSTSARSMVFRRAEYLLQFAHPSAILKGSMGRGRVGGMGRGKGKGRALQVAHRSLF